MSNGKDDNEVFDLVENSGDKLDLNAINPNDFKPEVKLTRFEKFLSWWDPNDVPEYQAANEIEKKRWERGFKDSEQKMTWKKYKNIYPNFEEFSNSKDSDDEWSDMFINEDWQYEGDPNPYHVKKQWMKTFFREGEDDDGNRIRWAEDFKGNKIWEETNRDSTTYHMGWRKGSMVEGKKVGADWEKLEEPYVLRYKPDKKSDEKPDWDISTW